MRTGSVYSWASVGFTCFYLDLEDDRFDVSILVTLENIYLPLIGLDWEDGFSVIDLVSFSVLIKNLYNEDTNYKIEKVSNNIICTGDANKLMIQYNSIKDIEIDGIKRLSLNSSKLNASKKDMKKSRPEYTKMTKKERMEMQNSDKEN